MRRNKQNSFDMIFVITLFCVFIVISLLLANLAAGVYKKTVGDAETAYRLRTSLSYVSGKLRYNSAVSVSTQSIDGTEVLLITEKLDGEEFDTAIYFRDGWLYEQTLPHGNRTELDTGLRILELDGFEMELSGKLLRLCASDSGRERELFVYTGGA